MPQEKNANVNAKSEEGDYPKPVNDSDSEVKEAEHQAGKEAEKAVLNGEEK